MTKLYTVTVEHTFVFASESDEPSVVQREFEAALRSSSNSDMRYELADGCVARVRPMACMPGDYDRAAQPWGGTGERTIGELIESGAAPAYQEALAKLAAKKDR